MHIMYQRVLPNGRRASFVPESWLADDVFQPGEFENLVFGGGGYKGIAYVGALKVTLRSTIPPLNFLTFGN